MTPAGRRVLLFLAMVATGLAAVFLLADPFGSRRPAHVTELTGAEDAGGRLKVRQPGAAGETQVVFGELDFDVLRDVRTADGRTEARVAARVHILSARPDADGTFVAQSPQVRLVDTDTGAERGTFSAREARFESDASVAGSVTVDLGSLRAENWSLHGDVRGEMPLRDGSVARVACAELLVRGALVRGPGRVTWTRDDLTFAGQDLLWDDATGRLQYESDAEVTLAASEQRLGLHLQAPGGLTFTIPPGAADPQAASYGELRGRVTGTASDGSRLGCQTLLFEGRARTFTLLGEAFVERAGPEGRATTLSARGITATADESGRFARAEADGDVRLLTTPASGLPAWMLADHLVLQGERAHAPGRVTWNHQGLVIAGNEFEWDGAVGQLAYATDAELAVADDSGHAWAGLRLLSPGGLSWVLPPGPGDPLAESRGRLLGPVDGTLPDGTTLAAGELTFDGPERRLRLLGGAELHRVLGGEESRLTGRTLTLLGDERGRVTRISAVGEAVLQSGAPGAPPTQLAGETLERAGTVVSSPARVTFSQGDLQASGTGLQWDSAAGHLDLLSDVLLSWIDPVSRMRYELFGPGGFTWTSPQGAADPVAAGHGELRGHVAGTASDGSTLAGETLLVDGPSRGLTLPGPAQVTLAEHDGRPPVTLDSEAVTLTSQPEGATLRTDAAARWSLGDVSGSGTGVSWDGATGRLRIERDVQLLRPDVGGAAPIALQADGPLDWTVPPGAEDALAAGRGELRGDVRVQAPGRTLQTERLVVEGPEGAAFLQGPSRVEASGPQGLTLSAQRGIALGTTLDGEPLHLQAEGRVESWLRPRDGGAPLHLLGDTLVVDRNERFVRLAGHALAERKEGTTPLSVKAAEHLLVRVDEQDQPRWLEARGGVELQSGDLAANTAELTWDLPADRLVLSGGGRLLTAGAWMSFASVEGQPEAGRFRIERSVVHVQD